MTKRMNIPFSPPDISDLEVEEVSKALKSGWITTGPRVKELEKKLANYVGAPTEAPNCVCLNSQTACGELSLRLLGSQMMTNAGRQNVCRFSGKRIIPSQMSGLSLLRFVGFEC